MTSQEEETLLYLNSRNSSLNPEGDFYFNIKPIENVTHLEIVNYQIGWFMQTISEINDTIIIKIFPNNITLEPIILEHGIYDTTRLITELNLKCNITTSSGVKKYPWTFSFYMNKENTLKIKLEGQYKATFINSLTTAKHILGMGSEYDIIIDNLPIPSSEYIFPNQISSIQINDLNNIIDLNITIVTSINPTVYECLDVKEQIVLTNNYYTSASLQEELNKKLNIKNINGSKKYNYILEISYNVIAKKIELLLVGKAEITILNTSNFLLNFLNLQANFIMNNIYTGKPGYQFTIDKVLDSLAPFTALNNILLYNIVGMPAEFTNNIAFTIGSVSIADILLKLDRLNYFNNVKQTTYNIIPSYENGHIKLSLYGNQAEVILLINSIEGSTAKTQLGLSEDILLSNSLNYKIEQSYYPINLLPYENLQIHLPGLISSYESNHDMKNDYSLAEVVNLSTFKPFDLLSPSAGNQAIKFETKRSTLNDILIRIVTPDDYTPLILYNNISFPFYICIKLYYIPSNSNY